jgi:tRNA(Ile)-lysidine synthase
MRSFERNLITEWRRLELPLSETTVVVAVSGGADSVSLLLGVNELQKISKLDIRVVAAHFNHDLRGEESDEDETFVRSLCSDRKIELAAGRSTQKHLSNVEQGARIERYTFLQQVAENVNAARVLTGHTLDDQAETFLLNLIRGSGIRGLSGMRPVRDLTSSINRIKLVRPLMTWARRADTETYCRELGVEYRQDTMNEDESFTRVRIRKILLPLLKDFNPKIVERLAETAALLREEIPDEPEVTAGDLKLADLKKLSDAEMGRLLRAWVTVNRGSLRQIELKHIDSIRRLVNGRKSGKTIELPGGDAVVKEDGKLVFGKNMVEKRGPEN